MILNNVKFLFHEIADGRSVLFLDENQKVDIFCRSWLGQDGNGKPPNETVVNAGLTQKDA
jgi:hypothetical protein